jgi:protein TonB
LEATSGSSRPLVSTAPAQPRPAEKTKLLPQKIAEAHQQATAIASDTPSDQPGSSAPGQASAAAQTGSGGVASVSGLSGRGTSPARFDDGSLNNPKPAYPISARRNGEEGRVLLRIHVSADGRPETVQVQSGSGVEALDAAAVTTEQRWRFVPALQDGRAVASWLLVPIIFKLENE